MEWENIKTWLKAGEKVSVRIAVVALLIAVFVF